ncbi:hypothetical protein [Ornithinimicrobium sp. W1665]|uniref:hypothetical protein n=1 Tax=Ornithinimicrobium sp. W1665 TaxID=3416666 RepID=UPI003CEA46E4
MIDVNKLTLGEVAKIEELSGQPITSFGDDDRPKGLALAAFAFIAKRREDPTFTWNKAQELTFEEANTILQPTPAAEDEEGSDPLDEPATPARSRKTQRKS